MAKKYDNIIFGLHPVEEALLDFKDIGKILVSRDERKPDYQEVRKLARKSSEEGGVGEECGGTGRDEAGGHAVIRKKKIYMV